jgi:hypothetical protein
VSALERRCRWLLRAYPAWYRRERAGEMLGTILEASSPGRAWPSFREARALVIGGLRVRGWTWLLSMLWMVAGAVITGYAFYITTQPWTMEVGIQGWSTDPLAVQITLGLALAAWLVLPVPVLIAGFIRLRGWRPRNWLRAAAWAGAWIAGFGLLYLSAVWAEYPGNSPATSGPAVVSWAELPICAAWLVLGGVVTWILAGPAHRADVPEPSNRARDEANRWPPGTGDLQT